MFKCINLSFLEILSNFLALKTNLNAMDERARGERARVGWSVGVRWCGVWRVGGEVYSCDVVGVEYGGW